MGPQVTLTGRTYRQAPEATTTAASVTARQSTGQGQRATVQGACACAHTLQDPRASLFLGLLSSTDCKRVVVEPRGGTTWNSCCADASTRRSGVKTTSSCMLASDPGSYDRILLCTATGPAAGVQTPLPIDPTTNKQHAHAWFAGNVPLQGVKCIQRHVSKPP